MCELLEEVHSFWTPRYFLLIFRVGDYKLIWGSRTTKDTWFEAKEEPLNKFVCGEIQSSRSKANRSRILIPRGVETMEALELDVDEDHEYEDDYANIEKQQAGTDLSAEVREFWVICPLTVIGQLVIREWVRKFE